MFKILELIMFDMDDVSYSYQFSEGINYFKGKNSSGKTEFYSFIDFMFGSSQDIIKKPWYINSLSKATIYFAYNDNKFCATRTRDQNYNFLHYADEPSTDAIDLSEYKDKMNAIFSQDVQFLKEIRRFTNEELTYRSFTMFNFLGEKGQGKIQDFLDKCSDIKYSVKLNPILNFIFNKNLEEIYELQRELEKLRNEVKALENSSHKFDFIINQVNENLQKLGSNIWYTGKNREDIKIYISSLSDMQSINKQTKKSNTADLEVMYNNLSEQIKVYENSMADAKQFEKDSISRKKLLFKLQVLLDENANFGYLIQPMKKLIDDIDNTIFFSNYIITDNTVKELRKQRDQIKTEIHRNNSKFKCYTLEQKSKAIALIEEFLSVEIISNEDCLNKKRKRICEIREELRALQNSDDIKKIKEVSDFVTELYCSAKDISSVVSDDMQQNGFEIKYLKKGNILQPMILSKETENLGEIKVNFYIGSMARHTLIQLCGYLAFLKILIKNNRYPVVPILVIDHISKPFDEKNSNAIGEVLSTAYKIIGKENLQTFIFDDEDFEKLHIHPDHFEDLVTNTKTGFNPFYFPPVSDKQAE